MVALNAAIVLAFELLITEATQRWPLVLVMALGFILLGVGRAVYALPLGLTVFILGTLIWTLAEIIAGPTMFAYPPLAAPDHLRGRYIAAANAMFGIGAAIGPIAGLSLWAVAGRHTWWIMSLLTFAGLALALSGVRQAVLKKAKQPDAPTESLAATQ
jgi:MFS family permease